MRRAFDQFVEFIAGAGTVTPGASRGIFLARAMREFRTVQVGDNAVQLPYYLTMDEYLPVPAWSNGGFSLDWSLCDVVEITQVPGKNFYVFHVDQVSSDDGTEYYRVWLADPPGGGVGGGGGLIFSGEATVTSTEFAGGLIFDGGELYGSVVRLLHIPFTDNWYGDVFGTYFAGLFLGVYTVFTSIPNVSFIFGGLATVTTSNAADLLFDSFSYPNDTQLDGHSLENGSELPKSWFTSEGSFKTAGGLLLQDGTGVGEEGRASGLVTSDVSDGTITTKMRCFLFLGDVKGGIRFRSSDLDNYWYASMDTVSGWVRLFKRVGGTDIEDSQQFAAITQSSVGFTTLQVVMEGTSISVVVDGVTLLTTTDSFNETEQTHGLIAFADGVTWTGNLWFDEWVLDT